MTQNQALQRAARQQRSAYNDMFGVGPWGQTLMPGAAGREHQELLNDLDLMYNDPQAYNRKAALAAFNALGLQQAEEARASNILGGSSRSYNGPLTSFSVPGGGQGTPKLTMNSQSSARKKYPNPFGA